MWKKDRFVCYFHLPSYGLQTAVEPVCVDRLCTKITSSYDVNNFRNIELNFQENAQQKTVGLTSDGNQIPVVIERDSSDEIVTVWVS